MQPKIPINEIATVRSLSASFVGWLLINAPSILTESESNQLNNLLQNVQIDIFVNYSNDSKKVDSRGEADNKPTRLKELKIFTDYPYYFSLLKKERFEFSNVENENEANFLFIVKNVKKFMNINNRLSQFPYEGGFVRKDLLIVTVRNYCATKDKETGEIIYPFWWLPCYDLSTEFHFFVRDYMNRYHQVQDMIEKKNCTLISDVYEDGDDLSQSHNNVRNKSQGDTIHDTHDTNSNLTSSSSSSFTNSFLSFSSHNSWIVKPAAGTRALGHVIVTRGDPQGLYEISTLCPKIQYRYDTNTATSTSTTSTPTKMSNVGPIDRNETNDDNNGNMRCTIIAVEPLSESVPERIVQLLIYKPLLVYQRKFDLRIFVLVRSFVPFEAYMHQLFYARLANNTYNVQELSTNNETALTVCSYSEDEEIAKKQQRLSRHQLYTQLNKEYKEQYIHKDGTNSKHIDTNNTMNNIQSGDDDVSREFPWNKLMRDIYILCQELFTKAAPSIGRWPRSSAYYSLDIMIDASAAPYQYIPKLIEVNFFGDWNSVEKVCELDDMDIQKEEENDNKIHKLNTQYENLSVEDETTVQSNLSPSTSTSISETATSFLSDGNHHQISYSDTQNKEKSMRFKYHDWIHDVMEVLGTSADMSMNTRLLPL